MQKIKSEEEPLSLITIEKKSSLWEEYFLETQHTLFTAIDIGLKHFPLYKEKGELSIVLADNLFIQQLNHEYRHKNKPTNVLSFPMEDLKKGTFLPAVPLLLLGDMVFAFETIWKESQEKKVSFQDHVFHLCIHSFLHLLGFDHETETDAEEMESLEVKLLRQYGIQNPYAFNGLED